MFSIRDMETKNVSLNVVDARKAPGVAVVMTIKYSCGSIAHLRSNSPPDALYAGAESAALAFSIFECIRDALVGTPVALAQSKVSSVCCSSSDKTFSVCWHTKGTVSAVRATVAKVVKCLAPWKQYTRYSDNIRFMQGMPDRAVFNRVAADFSDALDKIQIDVVGKMRYTTDHLKAIATAAHQKLPKQEKMKPASAPLAHPAEDIGFPFVEVKGLSATLTAEYIRSTSGGMGVAQWPTRLYVLNKGWEAKRRQLADKKRITAYVEQKYAKLKDDMGPTVAFLVATKCGHGDIKSAAKATKADIIKRIHETLSA
jgi:hypothetical protein